MAEFSIARREPVAYIGLPVATTMDTIPTAVEAGFMELERYVEMRGIDVTAASLIRYREVSYENPFVVEVGFVLADTPQEPRIREPFVFGDLLGGHFAVASQRGPYAWIGGLTRELMTWGDTRGMDYAATVGEDGTDVWDCWYELYPEPPVEGAHGPEGPVEVCLLVRA